MVCCCVCVPAHLNVCGYVCHNTHMWRLENSMWISGIELGLQAWWQMLFPAEASCWPLIMTFFMFVLTLSYPLLFPPSFPNTKSPSDFRCSIVIMGGWMDR